MLLSMMILLQKIAFTRKVDAVLRVRFLYIHFSHAARAGKSLSEIKALADELVADSYG